MRLLFGAPTAGDIFSTKNKRTLKDVPNVFSISDDILVEGYDFDGKVHDNILQICRKVNLKLNKDKCHCGRQ